MSCPTCDHTMQLLFMDAERTIHLCPRCGTAKSVLMGHPDVMVPRLVGRCRKFIAVIPVTVHADSMGAIDSEWFALGIAESINPPDHLKDSAGRVGRGRVETTTPGV